MRSSSTGPTEQVTIKFESATEDAEVGRGSSPRVNKSAVSNILHSETANAPGSLSSTQPARDRIIVADTGEGIPAQHLERLFERFYRVDRARSRDMGGTGLGLAIVKHLARAHGGEVAVTSELGTGSTFTIELPPLWPERTIEPPRRQERQEEFPGDKIYLRFSLALSAFCRLTLISLLRTRIGYATASSLFRFQNDSVGVRFGRKVPSPAR